MAAGNVDIDSAVEFLRTVWSGYILHAYRNRLGVIDRINRQLDEDAKFARVVNVNKISHLTVADKQNEIDVVYEQITETKKQITVDKWKYVAFRIDDIVRLQTDANLRAEYTDEIGYGLKRQQNADVTDLFSGAAYSVGVLGSALNEAERSAAFERLLLNDVDVEGQDNLTFFLSPSEYMGWIREEEIKNSNYSGTNEAIKAAQLKTLYGALVWQSNIITANSTGHDNALVHRDALTIIQQLAPRVVTEWVIQNISQAVVADTIYGIGELRPEGYVWMKGR